jgi:hypothetical protein
MKKFFILGVLLIALFITSGFIARLQAAEILYIEGNVQAQIAPEKAWKKAEPGMQLNIGDSIKTARRSKADIILDKDQKQSIRVEERTLLILDSTSPGLINKIDLSQGKVYANVDKVMAGLSFEVSTPSSVAGVRGTGWSVGSERQRDEVATYEGDVYLKTFNEQKNLLSETTVPAGFKSDVERFQGAGALAEVGAREMERWSGVKSELTQHVLEGPVKTEEKAADTAAIDAVQEVVEAMTEKIEEAKTGIEEKGTEELVEEEREKEEEPWW